MGETLAFGSLLIEGRPVRLAGQDSRRGTFGQRHAVIVDRVTGEDAHAAEAASTTGTTKFYVYDSLLSEYAAMGFEYGYSRRPPRRAGAAGRRSSATSPTARRRSSTSSSPRASRSGASTPASSLLLPHGYEGQGPDHSSARIERFLQMCAQDNMTVAQPSTPASYFHLLRWQALSNRRQAAGRLHAEVDAAAQGGGLGGGRVHLGRVPPGDRRRHGRPGQGAPGRALHRQGLLRPGERQGQARRTDVAIVRLERLYPLPADEIAAELARYPASTPSWCGRRTSRSTWAPGPSSR